jgi:hypothetical protein
MLFEEIRIPNLKELWLETFLLFSSWLVVWGVLKERNGGNSIFLFLSNYHTSLSSLSLSLNSQARNL